MLALLLRTLNETTRASVQCRYKPAGGYLHTCMGVVPRSQDVRPCPAQPTLAFTTVYRSKTDQDITMMTIRSISSSSYD